MSDDLIRIKNIWFLLLYAYELYRNVERSKIEECEQYPDKIPYLVAEILTDAVKRRLRRDLSLKYRARRADLSRIHGSIDLLRTETKNLLQQGKVACAFEDITVDTPANRCVRAALLKLAKSIRYYDPKDSDGISTKCLAAANRLEKAGVGYDTSFDFRRIREFRRTSRLNARDGEMLAAARLAFSLDLPISNQDIYKKHDRLWELFEKAIYGFYHFHFQNTEWHIRPQHSMTWNIKVLHSNSLTGDQICKLIPAMRPDIVLEYKSLPNHLVIIDTKYTDITKINQYNDPKLVSSHIYQLYTYLRSQENNDDDLTKSSSGILLYASNKNNDVYACVQGHIIGFVAISLDVDAALIRRRLLEIKSHIQHLPCTVQGKCIATYQPLKIKQMSDSTVKDYRTCFVHGQT